MHRRGVGCTLTTSAVLRCQLRSEVSPEGGGGAPLDVPLGRGPKPAGGRPDRQRRGSHASLRVAPRDAPTSSANAESTWKGWSAVSERTAESDFTAAGSQDNANRVGRTAPRASLSDFRRQSAHGLQKVRAVDAQNSEMKRRDDRSQIAEISTISDAAGMVAWLHSQPSVVSPTIIAEIASRMVSSSVSTSVKGGSDTDVRARLEADAKIENGAVAGSAFAVTQEDVQGYQRYLASRRSIPGSALLEAPVTDTFRDQRLPIADEYQVAVSGADSGPVGSLVSYMAKRKIIPTVETLQDLMLSDVSWVQAMRVAHIYVSVTGSTLPPAPMATKVMSTLLFSPVSHNKWQQGLSLYSSFFASGRQDELTAATHGFALQFIQRGLLSLKRPNKAGMPVYDSDRAFLWKAALQVMQSAGERLDASSTWRLGDEGPLGVSSTDALFVISSASSLMRNFGSWSDAIKVLSMAQLSPSSPLDEDEPGHMGGGEVALGATDGPDDVGQKERDLFSEEDEEVVGLGALSSIFGEDDFISSPLHAKTPPWDAVATTTTTPALIQSHRNNTLLHTPQTLIGGMLAALSGRSSSHLVLFAQAFDQLGYSYRSLGREQLAQLLMSLRGNLFAGVPFAWVGKVFGSITTPALPEHTPACLLLGTLAVLLEGSKSITVPLVNEPSPNLWVLGVRLFQAADVAPFHHLSESSIEGRIARTEALVAALVSVCCSCATIEERHEMTRAKRAWVRPTDLSPQEEREHMEGCMFEAGLAVNERVNSLLTRDLQLYMDASYGTQSIEAGLVAKSLLDYGGPNTIQSWLHALKLLGTVSRQLPTFSGQMSYARRGVRNYLVWASNAFPSHMTRRSRRASSPLPKIDAHLDWSAAIRILNQTPLLQQPLLGGDPYEGVSRAAILAGAGTVHTELIMRLLTSVPRTYQYHHYERRAIGTVLGSAIHATADVEGWLAFEARKHKLRYYEPSSTME